MGNAGHMGMTAGGETVSAVFDLFRGLFKFVAGDLRPVIRDILKLHHHGKLRVGEIRQHRGPYLAFAYLTAREESHTVQVKIN